MRKITAAAICAILAATTTQSFANDAPQNKSNQIATKDNVAEQIKEATALSPVEEIAKTSKHSVNVRGKKIDYTATAGTLTIRDDFGKPIASVFYTAYTAGNTSRPVTFLYNGGPGSSTLWLHMGGIGPVVVKTNSPDITKPAPYKLEANSESLLGKSDLVFIDAIGAGYSRPLGKTPGSRFWGVDQDVDGFTRAIIRYVKKYDRWNSPKYLFGESYGTTRSGALVNSLQNQGLDFSGVILLSSILNYGVRQSGFDNTYTSYLPSYAATAWYHNKIPNKPASLADFVEQARIFTNGEYSSALAKGNKISDAEKRDIAQKLSNFTGLSAQFIYNADLRVNLGRFRKELLRNQGVTIGRFDSRFLGQDADDAGESPEYDASSTHVTSAYISLLHNYLANDLGYRSDLDYRRSARVDPTFDWDWTHKTSEGKQLAPNVGVDLSEALRKNPSLKVLSLNGYYDMATPFFGTEYDIAHLSVNPELAQNVSFKYYPAGHMVYLNRDAMTTMMHDVDDFYDMTSAK